MAKKKTGKGRTKTRNSGGKGGGGLGSIGPGGKGGPKLKAPAKT